MPDALARKEFIYRLFVGIVLNLKRLDLNIGRKIGIRHEGSYWNENVMETGNGRQSLPKATGDFELISSVSKLFCKKLKIFL